MSRYAAVVLAGGQGSRFRAAGGAGPTKLVADFAGEALVRRVVKAGLASGADPVLVVTGHAQAAVEAALWGFDVRTVHNSRFATGLASTLKAGIMALPADVAGAVILLGDMPGVGADVIDRLIEAALAHPGAYAIVPVHAGRRGNPILLCRALFPAVALLEGDAGARHLLRQHGIVVREVECQEDAVTLDVDEPRDLAALLPPPEKR